MGVGAAVNQAQNFGLALVKQLQSAPSRPGPGKGATDDKEHSVHFRGKTGGVVGREHGMLSMMTQSYDHPPLFRRGHERRRLAQSSSDKVIVSGGGGDEVEMVVPEGQDDIMSPRWRGSRRYCRSRRSGRCR